MVAPQRHVLYFNDGDTVLNFYYITYNMLYYFFLTLATNGAVMINVTKLVNRFLK